MSSPEEVSGFEFLLEARDTSPHPPLSRIVCIEENAELLCPLYK